MREKLKKIKDFLMIGVVVLVVLSLFESGGSGSSSPEYQEEMYLAEQEALIEDHIEEQKYQEYEDENAWEYEPIYFLPNGYYYHSTKECKGLEGCYNIQEDIFGNISEYRHLDACNWCN